MKDNKIVILHVFIDGMTFSAVADKYDAMPNVKNLYYYYSPKEDFQLEKIKDNRVIVIHDFNEYVSYFSNPDIDVILFYSLPGCYYYLFDYIDDSKYVIWWGWGYDMYNSQENNPPLIKMDLYKPLTKAFMLQNSEASVLPSYKKWMIYKILSRLKRVCFNILMRENREYCLPKANKTQDDVLARIDAFYSPLDVEYDFLKNTHPSFKAKLFPRPVAPQIIPFRHLENLGNILVNHSLTYTTNHLDVFEYLYKIKLSIGRKYIMPVSYGINGYNGNPELLKKTSHFEEDQTMWLTKKLPYKEYDAILNTVTHAVFGMLRQQGLGNVYMCIRKNVKLYFFKDSLVYKELKKMGYVIFTIEDDLSTESLSSCLSEQDAKKNYDVYTERLESFRTQTSIDFIKSAIENKHINQDNQDVRL